MGGDFTLRHVGALFLIICLLPLWNCRPSQKLTPEMAALYQEEAHRMCTAIVDCMKEDVEARLKDEPERRDMVLRRMNRDLCLKGQYELIGRLSVDPTQKVRPASDELYKIYGECSQAVAASPGCAERKTTHRTHPACRKLRDIYRDDG